MRVRAAPRIIRVNDATAHRQCSAKKQQGGKEPAHTDPKVFFRIWNAQLARCASIRTRSGKKTRSYIYFFTRWISRLLGVAASAKPVGIHLPKTGPPSARRPPRGLAYVETQKRSR